MADWTSGETCPAFSLKVSILLMLPERLITILLESAGLLIWAWIAEELPKDVVPLSVGPDPVIRMPPRPVSLWWATIARPPEEEYVPDPAIMMLPLPVEVARTPPVMQFAAWQRKFPATVPAAVTKMLPSVEVRLIAL